MDDIDLCNLAPTDRLKTLRVLHVIPSLSAKHGGPSAAMPALARALGETGVEVTVVSTDDDGPGMRLQVPLGLEIQGRGANTFISGKTPTSTSSPGR